MRDRLLRAEGEVVEQHHLGRAVVQQLGGGRGADQAGPAHDQEAMALDGAASEGGI